MTISDERCSEVSTTSPVIQVARNLRVIANLAHALEAQAIAKATDRLMPGGLAMVALAGVANLEAFGNLIDSAERRALALAEQFGLDPDDLRPEIEPDDWEPPLQTLCFWSEAWRVEHRMEFVPEPHRPTPTIASEANFLHWALGWAWDNELHFADFAADMAKTRNRLENLLAEGIRPVARGVPCMYDECRGARLIRTTVPKRDKAGKKVWVLTDWHCPECERTYSEEDYERNIYAAIARSKVETVPLAPDWKQTEIWCSIDYAARHVDRPQATIRTWIHRGQAAVACIRSGQRQPFVRLADVEERDALARARWAARLAAMAAKLTTAV